MIVVCLIVGIIRVRLFCAELFVVAVVVCCVLVVTLGYLVFALGFGFDYCCVARFG